MIKKCKYLLMSIMLIVSLSSISFAQQEKTPPDPVKMRGIKTIIDSTKIAEYIERSIPEKMQEGTYKHVVNMINEQFSADEIETLAELLKSEVGQKLVTFSRHARSYLLNFGNSN